MTSALTWARLQWDRALAAVATLAGAILLIVGWVHISGTGFSLRTAPLTWPRRAWAGSSCSEWAGCSGSRRICATSGVSCAASGPGWMPRPAIGTASAPRERERSERANRQSSPANAEDRACEVEA